MMITLHLEPEQESSEVLHLVRTAIDSEIARLELVARLPRSR